MTVEAAQSVREKILADLSRRRRVASVQIEQLRAGRQRLLESYALVRRTLEEVHSDLQRADAEARVAADDAGRKAERDLPRPTVAGATAPLGDDRDSVGVLPWRPSDNAHAAATEPSAEHGFTTTLDPSTESLEVDDLLQRVRAEEDEPGSTNDQGQATPESEGEHLDDAEEALLQKRDHAVVDIELSLTRKLKRALQDDQNSLLDRLRNLRGAPTAARLLPDESRYRSDLADTARPLLLEAAAAGAAFGAEQCREQGIGPEASEAKGTGPDVDVADLVDELARGIIDPLRRRVEEAIEGAGDDQATLVDAVGAAYREWKSQRIERNVGDVIAAAFSRGSWSTVPEGTLLRWLPEDIDGPCPDCDDDNLAGALAKGEAWPTGQTYPPAHSGCRCLLVPVRA